MRIRHLSLTGLTVLLAGGMHPLTSTSAATLLEVNPADRLACMEQLHLTEEMLHYGIHRRRVISCIENMRYTRSQEVRRDRNSRRLQNTLDRMSRNSRLRYPQFAPQWRATEERPRPYQPAQVDNSIGTEELEQRTSRFRHRLPPGTERRSRRSIKREAQSRQSPAARRRMAEIYTERLHRALEECRHHVNSYQRENCVRLKLRIYGTEQRDQ